MPEKIISGQPPRPGDTTLVEKFQEEIVKQVDRLDDLAKELFKLEMLIPGLFVTVLKLIDKPTVPAWPYVVAFVFWAMALIITLYSLFPRPYQVMRDVPRGSAPNRYSIEGFYHTSARLKYITLLLASAAFFVGILFAVWAVVRL